MRKKNAAGTPAGGDEETGSREERQGDCSLGWPLRGCVPRCNIRGRQWSRGDGVM